MEKENLAKIACECLNLDCPEPDLSDWKSMVNDLRHPDKEVRLHWSENIPHYTMLTFPLWKL